MNEERVFVTYSWDNASHKSQVESLTEQLRQSGFSAEMDTLVTQKETAIDFTKMMHRAMTDYDKVIVVLSPGYKDKAENFKGGVGSEYSLMLKDINEYPNKYILVSFNGINDEICPLALKNRDTVDLSRDNGYESLFRKLMDVPAREFSPVASTKPNLTTQKVEPITSQLPNKLEFAGLWDETMPSQQFSQKYIFLTKMFEVNIKNIGPPTDEFSVEIDIPNIFTENSPVFSVNSGRKVFTFSPTKKLFTNQVFKTDPIQIKVTEKDMRKIESEEVVIRIYTNQGVTEERVPISALLYKRIGGERVPLTIDDFGK